MVFEVCNAGNLCQRVYICIIHRQALVQYLRCMRGPRKCPIRFAGERQIARAAQLRRGQVRLDRRPRSVRTAAVHAGDPVPLGEERFLRSDVGVHDPTPAVADNSFGTARNRGTTMARAVPLTNTTLPNQKLSCTRKDGYYIPLSIRHTARRFLYFY